MTTRERALRWEPVTLAELLADESELRFLADLSIVLGGPVSPYRLVLGSAPPHEDQRSEAGTRSPRSVAEPTPKRHPNGGPLIDGPGPPARVGSLKHERRVYDEQRRRVGRMTEEQKRRAEAEGEEVVAFDQDLELLETVCRASFLISDDGQEPILALADAMALFEPERLSPPQRAEHRRRWSHAFYPPSLNDQERADAERHAMDLRRRGASRLEVARHTGLGWREQRVLYGEPLPAVPDDSQTVCNMPLRERFRLLNNRGQLTLRGLARVVECDPSTLNRQLGLGRTAGSTHMVGRGDQRGERTYPGKVRDRIDLELATRVAEALGLDPVEAGL